MRLFLLILAIVIGLVGSAGAVLILVAVLHRPRAPITADSGAAAGIAVVLWLGIVTVAVAYWSYATGLRHLEPSETTMITLIEPVAAMLLGVVLLSERPSVIGWLGIAVVIIDSNI